MTDFGHANAARARGGAAGRKQKEIDNRADFTNGERGRQVRLRSWEDVASLTGRLEIIADRRDYLLSKIRWAQLKHDLGMDVDEFGEIRAAAEDLKLVCGAIHGRRA
jgi:hypothetical protein